MKLSTVTVMFYREFLDHTLTSRHEDCSILLRETLGERRAVLPGIWDVFTSNTINELAGGCSMKLNSTNRRRDLKRRRKLMPEPRRIAATSRASTDEEVISEAPSPIHNQHRVDLNHVADSSSEQVIAENRA